MVSAHPGSVQIITSRLCMAGHAAFSQGAAPLPIERQAELVSAMLPWLGCTHGYCRILSQLFIHRLLPAVIDHEQQQLDGPGTRRSSTTLDLQYLRYHLPPPPQTRRAAAVCSLSEVPIPSALCLPVAEGLPVLPRGRSVMAFLSEHREIVRMRAREVKAFEVSTLAHRCSFHGLLEHEINEYREIAPKHMLEELQEVRRLLTDASRSLSGRGRGDEEGWCRCCSAGWLAGWCWCR